MQRKDQWRQFEEDTLHTQCIWQEIKPRSFRDKEEILRQNDRHEEQFF